MSASILPGWEILAMFLALAAGIHLTRFLPFLLFANREKLPATVQYLGGALPHACMAFLLVYCLRNTNLLAAPHGLPEAVALAATVLLHLWRKNALLSIAAGTVVYMALVQAVFV